MENKDTNHSEGVVRVFGKNILAGPLYEGTDANTIVMYDGKGNPTVILARMVDKKWVMGSSVDPDWGAFKSRFGVQ